MPTVFSTFDKYMIRHYARKSGAGVTETLALINCYKASDIVGTINFHPEGQVPESKVETNTSGKQTIRVYYPITRISEILDTLRLEKPVYISVDTSNKLGWVSTDAESAGEQEGI